MYKAHPLLDVTREAPFVLQAVPSHQNDILAHWIWVSISLIVTMSLAITRFVLTYFLIVVKYA